MHQPVSPPQPSASNYTIALKPGASSGVVGGDLLQFVFQDSQTSSPALSGALVYLPVEEVSSQLLSPGEGLRPVQQITLRGMHAFWFRPAARSDFAALPFSPPGDSTSLAQLSPPQAAEWLIQPRNVPLAPILGWGFSTEQNHFVLETSRSVTKGIQAGSWLRLQFSPSFLPDDATALLLQVDSVRGVADESSTLPSSSPPGNPETVRIFAGSVWWVLDEGKAVDRYKSQPQIAALELELWVRQATGEISRLRDLGFVPAHKPDKPHDPATPKPRDAPAHPRYLGYLPTDAQLFKESDKAGTSPGVELWSEVSHPRFPLAAEGSTGTISYLPLGVPGFERREFYQPAVPIAGSTLERDGLAPAKSSPCSFFGADLVGGEGRDCDSERSAVPR